MSDLEEAARQALGALEQIAAAMPFPVGTQAITALRRALVASEYISAERVDETAERRHEQPAQEPVACLVDGDLYYPEEIDWETLQEQGHKVVPLYTRPQAREPQEVWVTPKLRPLAKLAHENSRKCPECGAGNPVMECDCGHRWEASKQEPLSDAEIKRIAAKWFLSMYWPLCNTFARAIEAAHGIKGGA